MARRVVSVFLVVSVLLLWQGPIAHACTIDGVASISMNGNTASLTSGVPAAATIAHWAPFTLLSVAPGDTVRLTEDLAKLRQTLPAAAFMHPFLWSFGDGASQQGLPATHRYARFGWHKITVSYFYAAQQRWLLFDSAQIQIMAAGDLLKANLGYYVAQDLQATLRVLIWIINIILGGLIVWVIWWWRHGREDTPQVGSGEAAGAACDSARLPEHRAQGAGLELPSDV